MCLEVAVQQGCREESSALCDCAEKSNGRRGHSRGHSQSTARAQPEHSQSTAEGTAEGTGRAQQKAQLAGM